jgi:hypothetical protein
MTVISTCDSIDPITAQSYERPVFSLKVERNWRNSETDFNSRVAVVPVVLGLHVRKMNERHSDDYG